MQPLDRQNLSVDAYAAHFWDLRYLVRASEVFQREDSVWAALRKLLQSALKNGTPPSNTTVDDTIRSCLQTRLLRSSAFGTPDSYDTRTATINAATSNAPPSGPHRIILLRPLLRHLLPISRLLLRPRPTPS
ncbi:hypothetical protein AeMF1_017912 [Aphanomyces euteiches]|nr:hypothetical protein AeMF1_017912 [Aphanomyces euteiches]KAH9158932.1 hypothetical protein AeNC1_019128 [Aphanomyces euteiches]